MRNSEDPFSDLLVGSVLQCPGTGVLVLASSSWVAAILIGFRV